MHVLVDPSVVAVCSTEIPAGAESDLLQPHSHANDSFVLDV